MAIRNLGEEVGRGGLVDKHTQAQRIWYNLFVYALHFPDSANIPSALFRLDLGSIRQTIPFLHPCFTEEHSILTSRQYAVQNRIHALINCTTLAQAQTVCTRLSLPPVITGLDFTFHFRCAELVATSEDSMSMGQSGWPGAV